MARVHRTDHAWQALALPTKTGIGTMVVEGYFTSSGVFSYPQEDGTMLREWRPPEEVADATSVSSLAFVPVTIDHPDEDVSIDNLDELQVGTVGDSVTVETSYGDDGNGVRMVRLRGRAVLVDPGAMKIVEDKELREVSCGYYADLELVAGVTPDGQVYDAIQRRITYNHLAMGVIGRHGPGVALRVDSQKRSASKPQPTTTTKETSMRKIIIDGVTFEGTEQIAEAIDREAKKAQAALADVVGRLDSKEKEVSALQAKVGETEARADAATAAEKNAKKELELVNAKIKEGVAARKKLERTAEKIMGAEAAAAANLDDLDDEGVKAAAVKHVNTAVDLTEKLALARKGDVGAVGYLTAAFDIAAASAGDADDEGADDGVEAAHADSVTTGAGSLRARTTRSDSATGADKADKARADAIAAKNLRWQQKA